MAIRFHLDEDVDHDIAHGLRQQGIDVTTATDAGLLGAADVDHIAFALATNRVLVTHDADFLRLASSGIDHAGFIYSPHGRRSIGHLVRFLCLVHDCMTSEEIRGRVEFVR